MDTGKTHTLKNAGLN